MESSRVRPRPRRPRGGYEWLAVPAVAASLAWWVWGQDGLTWVILGCLAWPFLAITLIIIAGSIYYVYRTAREEADRVQSSPAEAVVFLLVFAVGMATSYLYGLIAY